MESHNVPIPPPPPTQTLVAQPYHASRASRCLRFENVASFTKLIIWVHCRRVLAFISLYGDIITHPVLHCSRKAKSLNNLTRFICGSLLQPLDRDIFHRIPSMLIILLRKRSTILRLLLIICPFTSSYHRQATYIHMNLGLFI